MHPCRLRPPHAAVFAVALVAAALGVWALSGPTTLPRPVRPATPEAALGELVSGNERYVASRRVYSTDTAHDADDRRELEGGQHPFAAVLTCSDSRVCPEFIFDQRPGNIFDVRNAGNLVDEDVMASFEYAVEHLHVPLLMVLGHTRCGAVHAVHAADGRPLHDHLKAFQDHMAGLKEEVHRTHDDHSQECLDRLTRENTRQQAATLLRESEPVRAAVRAGRAKLVAALYHVETGAVELLH